MPKTALVIATSAVVLALLASPALAAPTANFDVSAGPYRTGTPITFTSTSTAPDTFTITNSDWNLGGVAATGPTVTRSFQNPGTYQITLTVTSDETTGNTATITKSVTVVTRPPVADFSFSPASPFVNDDVLFAADASDPDGDPLTYVWNWGDGTDDSHAHVPLHTFTSVGAHTVTLTVTDSHGAVDTVSHDVDVNGLPVPNNKPPHAKIVASRKTAQVGDSVEFVSSSYDSDGSIKSETWDLDGDGQFDDARGDDVFYTFTTTGTHTVRLRATDDTGQSAIAQLQIVITKPPKAHAGHISPDPKIRLNGLIYATGVRVQALGVRAPKGSLVTVRCKGKGCPVKQRRKLIRKGPVRFKTYERFLRAGIRLEIFVTKKGKIGDYTSWTIRRNRAPKRVDACVAGASLRRVSCR